MRRQLNIHKSGPSVCRSVTPARVVALQRRSVSQRANQNASAGRLPYRHDRSLWQDFIKSLKWRFLAPLHCLWSQKSWLGQEGRNWRLAFGSESLVYWEGRGQFVGRKKKGSLGKYKLLEKGFMERNWGNFVFRHFEASLWPTCTFQTKI